MKVKPEIILESIIRELGLKFEKEFRFSHRKFRFDYRIYDPLNESLKLGCEIEGGVWTDGRHTRGQGYSNDCTKYNIASILGWTVLRYTIQQIQIEPQQIVKDLKFIKERGKI